MEDESLIKEFNKYLFNDKSFGDKNYENQKFKLEPTKFNKEIFKSIVGNTYEKIEELHITPVLSEHGIVPKSYRNIAKNRHNILGTYIFFYDKLNKYIEQSDIEITELITNLLLVIKRDFQFVEIGLTQNNDPQMIFETMNGRSWSFL